MQKKVTILGSTGSIGTQSIDVCQNADFSVVSLSTNRNVKLLAEQVRKTGAKEAVVAEESGYQELKLLLKDQDTKVSCGYEEIRRIAEQDDSDIVLNSIVGIAGLGATLSAIDGGKTLALANKESLVTAGSLVMERAKEQGVEILPVDSEHSAIFQCLNGENWDRIERVLLTASGGPFFGYTKNQLQEVTKAQALKHPNWEMGAKITIDSSTLMNKGLEFIEAMHLFHLTPEQIEVVVHRQSILHSAVEFVDGSVIAQLGASDMRLPIQYALTYPERLVCPGKKLSLFEVGRMDFAPADLDTFICLRTAIEASKRGGLWAAAMNGANEEAVAGFLAGKLSYYDIFTTAGEILENITLPDKLTVEGVYEADAIGREYVKRRFS